MFFWAAHRSAAQHAGERRGLITIFGFPSALSLRTCRPAFSYSIHFQCMLYRGYRVRATRRRGKSKALVLLSCALPDTPASREQRPRFTCPEKRRENHTSCLRVRSVSAQGAAVWTGKNGRQYGMSARRCDRRCRKNTRILSFLRRTGNGISLASGPTLPTRIGDDPESIASAPKAAARIVYYKKRQGMTCEQPFA